ncbi:MAG: MmgE/PrpD family protein [Candidatus Freyarchaeota archaeon]
MNDEKAYTRIMAQFVKNLKYEELTDTAIQKAKEQLLGILGTICAGLDTIPGRILVETVREWGDRPEATVIGTSVRTSVRGAVLANSSLAQSYDYDDSVMYCHTGNSVVPVCLALAEKYKCSGEELLTAIVLGNEVEGRIGLAIHEGTLRGQVLSVPCHLIGSAAVASRLMGLTEEQVLNAMGIAGYLSTVPNVSGFFGPHSKLLSSGFPCLMGIIAADLASKGFTGSHEILEARDGFCSSLAYTPHLEFLTMGLGKEGVLGRRFRIETLGIKEYPVCYYTVPPIEATWELMDTHGFTPEDIEKIIVRAPAELATSADVCRRPQHTSIEALKNRRENSFMAVLFSTFPIAVGIIDKKFTTEQYSEDRLLDPKVHELAEKVVDTHGGEMTLTMLREFKAVVEVEIWTKNGKRYRSRKPLQLGGQPPEVAEKKFVKEAKTILEEKAIEEILHMIKSLEELKDCSELMKRLYKK